MPSREASHATWYSGRRMFVVPGAPVACDAEYATEIRRTYGR